ncbi:MAG: type II toxin-antitoxin system RelE/ParE family toxin [Gallionella sp.]
MPHIIYTQPAIEDLIRLHIFLASKSVVAAGKAKIAIVKSIKKLPLMPEAHKPVLSHPNIRDLIIDFGATGYIARYHYERGSNITILRIRHQKEIGFSDAD